MRNHDPSVHDPHRAPDRATGSDAVQSAAYLAGLLVRIAVALENDALSVFQFHHALAKPPPLRRGFHRGPSVRIVAAVSAFIEKAPRSILSPSNRPDPSFMGIDPGPGVVYESPPDPQIVPQATSAEVPAGLEWMTYG